MHVAEERTLQSYPVSERDMGTLGVALVSPFPAAILGHASPRSTLSVHARVMPGIAESAGAALSASLLG